jgi:hypothetical protein
MTPPHYATFHQRWSCDAGSAHREAHHSGHRSGATQPSESQIADGLAIVELLVSAGAIQLVQDESGRTALRDASDLAEAGRQPDERRDERDETDEEGPVGWPDTHREAGR